MVDTARLSIRVDSDGVSRANKDLGGLEKQGRRTERATDGLTSSFKRMLGPILATVSAGAALRKVIDVTREFDVLNAQLITATGSAENAAIAFGSIEDFAAKTPYDLAQVTESFTKLVNMGLTPSERALESYGNTASAMGKSMNQLIEAVADAATGEFERLKEFGIKSRNEGDKIAFTFRGVTTRVANNAAAIEEHLIALGENEFAGAMAERMDTLDGAMSNLGDSWDSLFREVSDQGIGDAIEGGVRAATDALDELTSVLDSGYLESRIGALGGRFSGFADDAGQSVVFVTDLLKSASGDWGDEIDWVAETLGSAFTEFPENVRAAIQLAAVEIATLIDYGQAYGSAFTDVLGHEIAKFVLKAEAYGKEIGDALNPFDGDTFDLDARLAELDSLAGDMNDAAFAAAESKVEASRQARMASIEDILAERETALRSYDDQTSAAEEMFAKYKADKKAATLEGGDEDVLAQFSTGATGGTSDADARALDKLEKSLMTEEEKILESYQRRRDIILVNTKENGEAQRDLLSRLNEDFANSATQGFGDDPNTHEARLQAVQDEFAKRLQLVEDNTRLEEERKTEIITELTKAREEQVAAIEAEQAQMRMRASAQLFDGLADLTKTFGDKQSGMYKVMFAASKAFSIAEAVIAIQAGIAKASSLQFPANIGAMATVASQTAGLVSTIKATDIEGIAHGGLDSVPKESTYLLDKGERVLSPNQNKDLTKFLQGDNSNSKPINIRVINEGSLPEMEGRAEVDDDNNIRLVVRAVKNDLRQDLHAGRGIWGEGQKKYGWSTKGAI